MRPIVIATRQSQLALWQANHIANLLKTKAPSLQVELLKITTRGDVILDRSLQKIGGKALFVKELEEAILAGKADMAVHSMKDVPSELPPGCQIAAITERSDHRDAFISQGVDNIADLPAGSIIGTSSIRRQVQLQILYPNLQIKPCRGNVNTRLAKLENGEYDALVLAAAGVQRLGEAARIKQTFNTEEMLSAPGQGAIGIECRQDDQELLALLESINHTQTWQCIQAERAFNHRLGGSCQVPVAAYAHIRENQCYLEGLLGSMAQHKILRQDIAGEVSEVAMLGKKLADELFAQGAADVLKEYQDE